jgi:hypothetical protein
MQTSIHISIHTFTRADTYTSGYVHASALHVKAGGPAILTCVAAIPCAARFATVQGVQQREGDGSTALQRGSRPQQARVAGSGRVAGNDAYCDQTPSRGAATCLGELARAVL